MSDHIHTSVQLVLGALLFGAAALLPPGALPLRLAGLVLLVAGYFGVLAWLGLSRPLNRLSAVLAGFGATAYAGWLCVEPAQPALAFFGVTTLLTGLFVTGIAGLHRDGVLRRAGALGALGAGVPLAALLVGHLALGGYGLLGLAWGQAVAAGGLVTWPAELLIAAICGATGLFWRRIGRAAD